MKLLEKLQSLDSTQIVFELSEMLNSDYKVRISWGANRIVSFKGYEGSVTLNELATIFFKAKAFDPYSSPGLQERLDCDALYERVQQLYKDSDAILDKICCVYPFIICCKEFECKSICKCPIDVQTEDPQKIIKEEDLGKKRERPFLFKSEDFEEYWKESQNKRAYPPMRDLIFSSDPDSLDWEPDLCEASKEMIEEKLR